MNSKLIREMDRAVESGIFQAGELLVGIDEKIAFHHHAGKSREKTHFDIASLTKTICTATLASILISKGVLKTDDTVYNWLARARRPHHKEMTVEMLLNHTSGLPAWEPYYQDLPLSYAGTPFAMRYILDACYNEPLINRPGFKTVYSDLGYIILGKIVEEAGANQLDELFRKYIANPLKLEDTFFVPTTQNLPSVKQNGRRRFAPTEDCPWRGHIMRGEVDDQNAYALGGIAGHAGLFSTATDLNKFIVQIVKALNCEEGWISQDVVKALFDFKKIHGGEQYLGGWNLPSAHNSSSGSFFSKRSIGHLAFSGCSIWIDLEERCWVILLTNRIHPSVTNQKITRFRPLIHNLIFKELITPIKG